MTNVELTHTGSGFGYLASIEPLSGANYGQWREKIEIGLVLHDMDLCLTTDPPTEPVEPVQQDGETAEAFAPVRGLTLHSFLSMALIRLRGISPTVSV